MTPETDPNERVLYRNTPPGSPHISALCECIAAAGVPLSEAHGGYVAPRWCGVVHAAWKAASSSRTELTSMLRAVHATQDAPGALLAMWELHGQTATSARILRAWIQNLNTATSLQAENT